MPFQQAVESFLNETDQLFLLVAVQGGNLTLLDQVPATANDPILYFFKSVGKVSPAGISSEVSCGTTVKPLDMLQLLLENVFLPLVGNPKNREAWSHVVGKEVLDSSFTFSSSLSIARGQFYGRTLLPLPPEPSLQERISEKERIHYLEGCIILWTKQIKTVLAQEPEDVMKAIKNPGPLEELRFWARKARHLNAVYQQLLSKRIQDVLRLMHYAESSYGPPFQALCQDVFRARREANSNVQFLGKLKPWLSHLEAAMSLEACAEFFVPLLHAIMNVWKYSPHYNTTQRLVVLLREICNTLIRKGLASVSGGEVFDLLTANDGHVAVGKLMMVLQVCGEFKKTFFDYKAKVAAEVPSNPWKMKNDVVFLRYDRFLERCNDMKDFCETVLQFSKLSQVEVGGTKGRTLTHSVAQIYADFLTGVNIMFNVPYDLLDIEYTRFDDDYYDFRCRVKELERRIASVLTQVRARSCCHLLEAHLLTPCVCLCHCFSFVRSRGLRTHPRWKLAASSLILFLGCWSAQLWRMNWKRSMWCCSINLLMN